MAEKTDNPTTEQKFENRLTTLETNFAVFVQEMKDFKEEMRSFKEEMKEFKVEMRANYAEALNINRHVHNLTVAAMVGIGAMALSGGAIAVAVVYSVLSR